MTSAAWRSGAGACLARYGNCPGGRGEEARAGPCGQGRALIREVDWAEPV
jgi:hypothetical protein